MTERLQAAVGVHGKFAVEIEHAVKNIAPCGAACRELEIFHKKKFGGRKAVVNFGHCNLFTSIGNARLGIGIDRACSDLGEGRVVVVRVGESAAVASDERKRLHVDRLVGVLMRIFSATHDCCS